MGEAIAFVGPDAAAIRAFGIPPAKIENGNVVWPTDELMAKSYDPKSRTVIGVDWLKPDSATQTLGRIGAPYYTRIPLSWLPSTQGERIMEMISEAA